MVYDDREVGRSQRLFCKSSSPVRRRCLVWQFDFAWTVGRPLLLECLGPESKNFLEREHVSGRSLSTEGFLHYDSQIVMLVEYS